MQIHPILCQNKHFAHNSFNVYDWTAVVHNTERVSLLFALNISPCLKLGYRNCKSNNSVVCKMKIFALIHSNKLLNGYFPFTRASRAANQSDDVYIFVVDKKLNSCGGGKSQKAFKTFDFTFSLSIFCVDWEGARKEHNNFCKKWERERL